MVMVGSSLIPSLTAKGVPAKQTSETSDHLVLHSLIRAWFGSPGHGFRPLPRALVAATAAYPAAVQSPETPAPPFQIGGTGRGGGRLTSPRCLIPRAGGLKQGRILPRESSARQPRPRGREATEGGGEEEWSGRYGRDLPGLDDSLDHSPNPRKPREGSPLIGQESEGAREGSTALGGGEGAERAEAVS